MAGKNARRAVIGIREEENFSSSSIPYYLLHYLFFAGWIKQFRKKGGS